MAMPVEMHKSPLVALALYHRSHQSKPAIITLAVYSLYNTA